jgi:pimeloyl-ACP methyl ester carboxylesterase
MMGENYGSRVDRLHSEILRICERLLESSDLSIDDDFFDKGGDSLLATELMLELRKLTGKDLPDSLLFESSTVRALAHRLSEKEAPQRKAAVRVGAASDDAKPLLFFHGDWTRGGFYVEHLARKLGSEISLIAVAPHGSGGEPIPPSIEEMAADRLPVILEAQPTGPYRLAGHCVGGIVALETARLLMKLNHQVETVVMIDSPHPSMTRIDCKDINGTAANPDIQFTFLGYTFRPRKAVDKYESVWRRVRSLIGWLIRMIGGEVSRTQAAHGGGDAAAPDLGPASEDITIPPATPVVDWGFELYEKRLAAYSPTPLPARLRVLASEYDGRGWARLSGDAELVEIPGGHFDLVTVRINELADNLRSWLSGDGSLGLSKRNPLAPTWKGQTSSAVSSSRESGQSSVREDEDKVLAPDRSDKEIPVSRIGAAKHESISRRLRRFLNYARG